MGLLKQLAVKNGLLFTRYKFWSLGKQSKRQGEGESERLGEGERERHADEHSESQCQEALGRSLPGLPCRATTIGLTKRVCAAHS